MIKKICFYIFLFFCLLLNIIVDINVPKYFNILNKCFNKTIILTDKLYAIICIILALISILLVIDILLVLHKNKNENKGFKIKEDGTYGTSKWMEENELRNVLGIDNVPGIILGKNKGHLVKLPFDSHFNKNICIFGSSGSMKTIRLFNYKFIRTFKIPKINYSNRSERRNI